MPSNIGVIMEQGFVAGSGLGFTEIDEQELNKKDSDKEEKETK